MEAVIIIGLVVWFISTIPETNRRYKAQQKLDALDAKNNAREDAYFADLVAKADSGDVQAATTLVYVFRYQTREGWNLAKPNA